MARDFKKLSSDKFPELEVKETIAEAETVPTCTFCNEEMCASVFKAAEKLEVIPSSITSRDTSEPSIIVNPAMEIWSMLHPFHPSPVARTAVIRW